MKKIVSKKMNVVIPMGNVTPEPEKKNIAELMNAVEVKFSTGNMTAIKTVSEDIAEYIKGNAIYLQQREKELASGGKLLDETIIRYHMVTGKGVTKSDMVAILTAANSKRKDVNGYVATFASDKAGTRKAGCPSRVMRYKADGLYCVALS